MNKLVKECLLEFIIENPYAAMGIGRRVQIEEWLKKYDIKKYTINEDFTIDVDQSVRFEYISDLPSFIQFNISSSDFMFFNCNMTTLRGCPKKVKGCFSCVNSNLNSLEYCPTHVGKHFSCAHNNLTSLKGCPKIIGGCFLCMKNKKRFSVKYVRSLCKVHRNIYNKVSSTFFMLDFDEEIYKQILYI